MVVFSVAGYSGRGIGPGNGRWRRISPMVWLVSEKALSIPTTLLRDIPFEELKRLFYEWVHTPIISGSSLNALD